MKKKLIRTSYYLWTYMILVTAVLNILFMGYVCISNSYNVLGNYSALLLSISSCFFSASIFINNMAQAEKSSIAFLKEDSIKTEHVRSLSAFLYGICAMIGGYLAGSFLLTVCACIITVAYIIIIILTRM